MKNKKAPILICAAVILAAAAAAVFALPEKKNLDFFAMDTLVNFNITARGADKITEEAKDRVNALDTEVLSRQSASSEIYSLNKNHGGKMSAQVGEYISVLLDVFKKSGGAFDFTLGALSDLWGFGGEPSVPPEDKIGEILALTGADKITIDGGNIEFPQGAVLDFGAAGKGIALDEIKEILDIDGGECTADGKFSLDACRCIGACGLAPVMTVNGEVYGRLVPGDVAGILEKYN